MSNHIKGFHVLTGRFKIKIPIILFGKDFWKQTINFEYLRDVGVISDRDYEML